MENDDIFKTLIRGYLKAFETLAAAGRQTRRALGKKGGCLGTQEAKLLEQLLKSKLAIARAGVGGGGGDSGKRVLQELL